MNVVCLIRSVDGGGAEWQAITLARKLCDLGHDVNVVVLHASAADPDLGVPTVVVGRGSLGLVGVPARLTRAIRRIEPDVVLSYLAGPNVLAAVAKPFLRGTAVVWGLRATAVDLRHEVPLARIVHWVEPWLSRLSDRIIVNAERARDDAVARGFRPADLVVVPNGIDVDRFRPNDERRWSERARLGLTADDVVLARVGRLHPMKDLESALSALAELVPANPRVRLIVVGDGDQDYRGRLQRLAATLGVADHVEWLGRRDDLDLLYPAFDVVLSSSAYGEASPNVIGEAMACGVPCVVTDVGDSAALVADCGVVVSPRSAHALAAGIAELLDRRDDDLGTRCRARIIEHYSAAALAERTVAAVQQVVESKRSRRRCAASQA